MSDPSPKAGGCRRIVCLAEESTEILYHLGEQDRIVGITEYTRRPPEAIREKPVISQFLRAVLQAIEALAPDLVIGFSDLQAPIAAQLIERGLNVLDFNQRGVADILRVVETVAALVDRGEAGRRYAADRTLGDPAEIPARGPDLMLASWCGATFKPATVKRRPGFAAAPFVRRDRLVEIPSAIILQPGPAALTDGSDAIHAAIARVARADAAAGDA